MLRRSSVAVRASCRVGRHRGQTHPSMSVQVCPGCQGRNLPQAETCEWCGRPFDGRASGFALRWWHRGHGAAVRIRRASRRSVWSFLSASRLPSALRSSPTAGGSPDAARRGDGAANAGRDARPDAGDAEAGQLAGRHRAAAAARHRRRAAAGPLRPGRQHQRPRRLLARGAGRRASASAGHRRGRAAAAGRSGADGPGADLAAVRA